MYRGRTRTARAHAQGAQGTGGGKEETLQDQKEESKEGDVHKEKKSQLETSQCWKKHFQEI